MASSSSQKEIEPELRDAGNKLLKPPSSTDELLSLLDKVEILLSKVEQAPSTSMQEALQPSREALIASELLKHSDMEVKASVVCCINEIIRITAPDAPYSDDKMKEIFQLTVMALEKLSLVSGRCYNKALCILDTVANVRSCLVMLDLECDDLIVEMFKHFLSSIRSNHPKAVFSDMEAIMTLVVEESEEISKDLLLPLLTSLKKENQNGSPLSWKLGENVMRNSAAKLKPYLQEAVNSLGIAFKDYAEVVASICRDVSEEGNLDTSEKKLQERKDSDEPSQDTTGKKLQERKDLDKPSQVAKVLVPDGDVDESNSLKTLEPCSQAKQNGTDAAAGTDHENVESTEAVVPETEPEPVLMRRGRRPNSLRKPEEGYDHSWVIGARKSLELPRRKKNHEKKISASSSKDPSSKEPENENEANPEIFSPTTPHEEGASISPSQNPIFSEGNRPKRGRPPKKNGSQPKDVVLRKESEGTRNSKGKFGRGKSVKTTPLLPVKMEDGISCEHEGKQVSSIQQMDGKKRKLVSEESRGKNNVTLSVTKSLTKGEIQVDDVSGTKGKGELTPRNEKDPEMNHGVKDYDEELVGWKIKVWWPMDEMFYEGAILSFDPTKKKHRVSYADGDEEILDLSKELWELVGKTNPRDKGKETHLPSPDALSDMRPKKKTKTMSASSIKLNKTNSISRSSVGNALKKLNVEAPESNCYTSGTIRIVDVPSDKSKPCENLNANGQKSTGKPRMKSPRMKSGTPKNMAKSKGKRIISNSKVDGQKSMGKSKIKIPETVVKSEAERTKMDNGGGESGDTITKQEVREEQRRDAYRRDADAKEEILPNHPLETQERETESGKKRQRLIKS